MPNRKPRKLTQQEALVAAFCKHSISSRSTFHPKQWKNGKEPADMLIQIGRALLFVNMTTSKAYFDDLAAHNINQARDRILEWQSSASQLRGANEWASFAISWDDVDHVHVVSVVEGPHAACADHGLAGLDMPAKVRLCTTLTTAVMHRIAFLGGGARDLIAVCKEIRARGKTSESKAIRLVRRHYETLEYDAKARITLQPSLMGKAIIHGRELNAFEEHKFKFEVMRRQPEKEGLEVFSDLAWADYFPAIAFIVQSRAEMEALPQGQIRASVFGNKMKFQVVVSSNMEGLAANMTKLSEMGKREGSVFTYCISLINGGLIEFFSVSREPYLSATEFELSAL